MNESAAPLVRLKGAGLQRADKWLVRGLTFAVRPREIVTLIGPNGSGKSTTARLALGIERPSEGQVERKAGLRVGYVPQKLALDWTMPLNVETLMSLTQPLSRDEMTSSLRETGADHLLKRDARNLSGGEMQRVLLARAIARKPDLLVLDEPVQGVDFTGEAQIYDLILAARDRLGAGVLLISHDLHMVMAATDHVICLNGHICCEGTPQAVAVDPVYRQMFGDRAASGLAVYEHRHDHTHLADGRVLHGDGSISDHCHPDDGHHQHRSKSPSGGFIFPEPTRQVRRDAR